MDKQRRDYFDRIDRLKKSNGSLSDMPPTQTQIMYRNRYLSSMIERHDAFMAQFPAYKKDKSILRFKITPLISYLLAFAMGALAAMIAQFLRFQIEGNAGPIFAADTDLALDVIFSIVVAFILREIVSLSAVKRMGAQVVGILLTIVTMHNAVHHMPDVFTQVFSSQWVSSVMSQTEAGTLYFRGESYRI